MGTLISILEQRGGIPLYDKNVVIKSTGGLKLNQQSVNLAVLMSVASSALQKSISNQTVFIGDVGLTGELKKVPSLDMMVRETARLGFQKIYIPRGSLKKETWAHIDGSRIMEMRTLTDVIRSEFGDYRKELID